MKIAAASAVLLLAFAANADVRYAVTDLGTLGNFTATAKGISSNGLIVGAANQASGYDFAVRLTPGGVPQVITGEGASGAFASAVNSSGTVVGLTDSLSLHAFVLDGSGLHDLGNGGLVSVANDLNDTGVIVGGGGAPSGLNHAIKWQWDGSTYAATPLPGLGGFTSVANSINAAGVIAGTAELPTGYQMACIWTSEGVQPLGVHTSSFAEAMGINDAGQVVGYSFTETGTVAFLWSEEGGDINLGGLGNAHSIARAINNRGVVVGQSYIAGTSATQHAFVWKNGAISDLNSLIAPGSGWLLWDATDINDSGLIVGGGILNGQPHAFLLTPLACAADLGSAGGVASSDGVLDNNDFIAFIGRFFDRASEADMGRAGGVGGADGAWDNNDFIVFIARFFEGC